MLYQAVSTTWLTMKIFGPPRRRRCGAAPVSTKSVRSFFAGKDHVKDQCSDIGYTLHTTRYVQGCKLVNVDSEGLSPP